MASEKIALIDAFLVASVLALVLLVGYFILIIKAAWNRKKKRLSKQGPIDRIWEHLVHYRRTRRGNLGFVVVNSFAVSLLVFLVIYLGERLAVSRGYEVTNDGELAITISGLAIGLIFGLFTFLSWFNTLELLYYQQSQIDGYDQLLGSVIGDMKELVGSLSALPRDEMIERVEREGSNSLIRILSPSPAIGNISAEYDRFEKFKSFFLEEPFRDRLCPQLLMRSDFSLWHEQFIGARIEHLIQNMKGRRTVGLARRQIMKEFGKQWFRDIKHDPTADGKNLSWAMRRVEQLVDELLLLLNRQASTQDAVARFEVLAQSQLKDFAHRTADVQVLNMIKSFKNVDHVSLLDGLGDAFPPVIAVVVSDRYYLAWMARRINGTSNDLRGYVSSERSALQIIEQIFDHYENIEASMGVKEVAIIPGSDLLGNNTLVKSKTLKQLYDTYAGSEAG